VTASSSPENIQEEEKKKIEGNIYKERYRRRDIEEDFNRVNGRRFRGGKDGKWGKNIGVEAAGR